MSGLQDKVVLITGASSGIGEGTAEAFAKEKCKLAIVGRNVDNLNKVAAKCRELGASEVFVAPHDLSSAEACKTCVDEAVEKFGGKRASIIIDLD